MDLPTLVSMVATAAGAAAVVYRLGAEKRKLIAEAHRAEIEATGELLSRHSSEIERLEGENDSLRDRVTSIEEMERKCQANMRKLQVRLMNLERTVGQQSGR